MVRAVRAASLDALVDEAIPAHIRLDAPVELAAPEGEFAYLTRLKGLAARNKLFRSFLGLGYYDTVTPSVILRMVFENPGWYTPYTPYQAEIAQGRLESLLNFQTMVADLTGMEVANASLLDEATAAAEAMALLHRAQPGKGAGVRNVFLVSERCYPQTLAVVRTRAEPLGVEVRVAAVTPDAVDETTFGVLLQYPDEAGAIEDLEPLITAAQSHRSNEGRGLEPQPGVSSGDGPNPGAAVGDRRSHSCQRSVSRYRPHTRPSTDPETEQDSCGVPGSGRGNACH